VDGISLLTQHAIGETKVKPFTISQVWTLNATYSDPQHGVSFRYPSVWKARTQFGYVSPALTESDEKPVAGFGYEEGSIPRSGVIGPYSATNLEGFGVLYSAVPAVNAIACEAAASSLATSLSEAKRRAVFLGGRSFSEYDIDQSAMSQSNYGKLYATYLHPTCFFFETDMAVLEGGGSGGDQILTPEQLRTIEIHLLDIMKSVRIAPSP
jgi:hypothetical protein